MRITESAAILVYDANENLVAISVNDEKSREVISYNVQKMQFKDLTSFLVKVSKNTRPLPKEVPQLG